MKLYVSNDSRYGPYVADTRPKWDAVFKFWLDTPRLCEEYETEDLHPMWKALGLRRPRVGWCREYEVRGGVVKFVREWNGGEK